MGDAASPGVTTPPVVTDPSALRAEVQRITEERYIATYTSQRTAGFFFAVVLFALALSALPFIPTVRAFIRVGPAEMGGAMAAAIGAIGIATLAAHRPSGILGAAHKNAERIESFVTAAVAAFLIRASNDATSIFWLISVMHAFFGSTETMHAKWNHRAHGLCLTIVALSFAVTGKFGDAAAVVFFTVLLLFLARSNETSARTAITLQAERNIERERYEGLLVERERRRIARDLHDGLGAQLASIAWSADALTGVAVHDEALKEIGTRARSMLGELREVVHGLKATDMPLAALVDSLAASCRPFASKCALSFGHAGDALVRAELCLELTLIIHEAVRNAVQHAEPARIDVHVDATSERLTVRIDDDGAGLPADAEALSRGGLAHLRERAAQLRGEIAFERPTAGGTRVLLRVPR